jgi:hypothetical protein
LTYSSGSISVDVPDESEAGVTTSIDVAAPVGNVITNLRVKINLTHASIGDLVINLKAPNGKVLNLFAYPGSGDNMVNTVISSQGEKHIFYRGNQRESPEYAREGAKGYFRRDRAAAGYSFKHVEG